MYLTLDDTAVLMQEIGRLSAPGSAVFHDACRCACHDEHRLHAGAHANGPIHRGEARSHLAPSRAPSARCPWHSAGYVANGRGPVVGGAKFLGGSDDYGLLWRRHAGFERTYGALRPAGPGLR